MSKLDMDRLYALVFLQNGYYLISLTKISLSVEDDLESLVELYRSWQI